MAVRDCYHVLGCTTTTTVQYYSTVSNMRAVLLSRSASLSLHYDCYLAWAFSYFEFRRYL